MKVIYLNVNANQPPQVLEIEDHLQLYYDLIECDTIDIVERKIENRNFRIICDDEGLLKMPEKISAISSRGKIQFVGNLIICSDVVTEAGELVGLTDEEVIYILARIKKLRTVSNPKGYYVLTCCDY